MIGDILDNIFSPYSSFGERCLAAFIVLTVLLAIGLVGLLVCMLVDSVGIAPTKTTVATVEAKQVIPAHTTTMLVGKIMVPQFHPESYRLHFKIDGYKISPTVEKKIFDEVNVGERIEVDYGFGRLSNTHQPTRIRLANR